MENQVTARNVPLPSVGANSMKVLRMLDGWITAHELPPGITPDLLYAAEADARHALEPASGEAFAVLIDRLFQFAETFSIKDAGIRDAMKFYVEALDDIPPDLLERAIDGVVRNYKYGHRLPPPADLRAVVEEELSARMKARARIEAAQKFGRYDTPREPPSQADKDRAATILEETRRHLTAPEGE